MTRIVSEPATLKKVSEQAAKVESLSHRPAPVVAAAGAFMSEWIRVSSTTDWGAGYTILDFVLEDSKYDGTNPTFALNANSNLEIKKDGLYVVTAALRGWADAASVDTVRKLEADVIAGEIPKGMFSPWTTSREAAWITRLNRVSPQNVSISPWPAFQDFMYFNNGTFPTGVASELQIRAVKEENAVAVAETQPIVYMFVARLGGPFV